MTISELAQFYESLASNLSALRNTTYELSMADNHVPLLLKVPGSVAMGTDLAYHLREAERYAEKLAQKFREAESRELRLEPPDDPPPPRAA